MPWNTVIIAANPVGNATRQILSLLHVVILTMCAAQRCVADRGPRPDPTPHSGSKTLRLKKLGCLIVSATCFHMPTPR